MGKLELEDYIYLIDRMLEREGFAGVERDEIFNYPNNIELISTYFNHKKHPSLLIKKLDRSPVQAMYASIDEAKRKPKTKKGKKKKFKKVMGEFGKGKLRPYHGKRNLKSKKQDGSKMEHKQALAIAFSEAGIKEELNKAKYKLVKENIDSDLPQGQQYAIDFLRPLGLTFISTPLQIKKGNLTFVDGDKVKWAITKTGYVRKLRYEKKYEYQILKWDLIYSHFPPQHEEGKQFIEDDEYIELAHILSEKITKSRRPKPEFRISYVNKVYRSLKNNIKDELGGTPFYTTATKREVEEAIKKLYNKYIK